MIFTGYVFPDAASISPYLEEPRVGPTSRFCADLAARLHCHVVAGYPERLVPHEREKAVSEDGVEVTKIGANSAVLYGPTGTFVDGYRKTNLFETDMTWAKAGTGFATFTLSHPLNTVSIGICMDLNPQPSIIWDIDEGPYEVADYCIAKKTNLLILLNAWLDSGAEPEKNTDWQTLNYWAARLRPLWAKIAKEDPSNKHRYEEADEAEEFTRQPGEELIVVICNRCGEENGKLFAGSSAIFSLTRGAGRPLLLHAMGRRTEGVVIWKAHDDHRNTLTIR